MTDMVVVYAVGLILPLVLAATRLLYFWRNGIKPTEVVRLEGRDATINGIDMAMGLIAVSGFIYAILPSFTGRAVDWLSVMAALLLGSAPLVERTARSMRLTFRVKEGMTVAMSFLIVAACLGLHTGTRERRTSYADQMGHHGRCDAYLVQRRIGGMILAIAPDSRQIMINEDCEVKVRFDG